MNDPKKVFLASILAVLLAQTGLAWGGSGVSETTSTLPSNIPPEYQDAISKVLPGYEILRNEDLLQDENQLKNFLSPDEIAKRNKRKSLGFIEGRFNDDRFMDFAAWVVNRSIKQESPAGMTKTEKFAARLVICLGTSTTREYQCEVLPTLDGDFIGLPYWADIKLFKVREVIQCGDLDHQIAAYDIPITAFYPEGWKGKRPSGGRSEVPARKLHLNYDAIGEYAIGSNAGRTLVRGADGIYLDCANAD
jgi:hypothetical protein